MTVMKHFFGCAVIGAIVVVFCSPAGAQFGGVGGPEGAAEAQAEKSLIADGAPAAADMKLSAQDFCQCVGESESPAVEKIEKALRGPLHSTGLDFVEIPLMDVITTLQQEYGIPIKLDSHALEETGINRDETVTVNIHNVSLRSALRLMLKELQLTYVIVDEVLMITTPEAAESNLKTCVYDIGSLTGDRGADFDSIIDAIVSCVATDTWSENGGGEAEIRPIKPGLIVVSQTAAVHEEVRNLLEALRKMRGAHKPGEKSAAASAPAAADEVVTRSYSLQLNPTDNVDTMRSQVRELIEHSLPEEAWTGKLADGQAVTLSVFHDRIVVRQTPAVQEKVQKLLTDSGIARPARSGEENRGGGFFGGGGGGGFGGGSRSAGIGFSNPERGGVGGGRYDAIGAFPNNAGPEFGEGGIPGAVAPGLGGEGFAPEPAVGE
jgi:hypothetical protein